MYFILNSTHDGAKSKEHKAPIPSENASGNPCTNYCLYVPKITSTVKTKALKHIVAASNGLTNELWNIISISTFHYPDHEALFTLCKGHTLTLYNTLEEN